MTTPTLRDAAMAALTDARNMEAPSVFADRARLESVVANLERIVTLTAPEQSPADGGLWSSDDALTDALCERDRCHEWADGLADAIAKHTGVDIGEHSSANNPWQEALEAISAAPTLAEYAEAAATPAAPTSGEPVASKCGLTECQGRPMCARCEKWEEDDATTPSAAQAEGRANAIKLVEHLESRLTAAPEKLEGPSEPAEAQTVGGWTTIGEQVMRFLAWPLPEDVCADQCAIKCGSGRFGTNLLTAQQAEQMIRHIIGRPERAEPVEVQPVAAAVRRSKGWAPQPTCIEPINGHVPTPGALYYAAPAPHQQAAQPEKLAPAPQQAGQARLIGWRTDDYLMETADKAKADNWSTHFKILPIFEGDPHTKLGATPPSPQQAAQGGERPWARQHELKTDPEVFEAVFCGAKTFEIRFNDRGFQVGDRLLLRETTHTGDEIKAGAELNYTGREAVRFVSHVLTGYGLEDGWCCLSFAGFAARAAQGGWEGLTAGRRNEAAWCAGLLEAMRHNYRAGHQWDHLDGKACLRTAELLRELLRDPSPAQSGITTPAGDSAASQGGSGGGA